MPKRASVTATVAPRKARSSRFNDEKITDSVAKVLKDAYDVLEQNLAQGRQAASRFRRGDYRIGEVPGDLREMSWRLLKLGQEFSATLFTICDELLKEGNSTKDKGAGAFRPDSPRAPPGPAMDVSVHFRGKRRAVSHTTSLQRRPSGPTLPSDIKATLTQEGTKSKPITAVTFGADVSVAGLIVTIGLTDTQPIGVYTGAVYAKDDKVPLGMLTIEIVK